MLEKRGILVRLDKPRHLSLDIAAVARFEFSTFKPFFSTRTWEDLSKRDTVLLLWACLAWEDPKLTPADVVKMFELEGVDEEVVIEKVKTAWAALINNLMGGN